MPPRFLRNDCCEKFERTELARCFFGLPGMKTTRFSKVGRRMIADINTCVSYRPSLTPVQYSNPVSATSGCPPVWN